MPYSVCLEITKEMHGLLVNFEANPACEDSTAKLHQL